VFYIDVAKVDRDVAHVAMAIHVFSSVCFMCFRHMFQEFHLDVAYTSVCFKCFWCFINILQVFLLDVAYVLQWPQICSSIFLGVFKCFRCTLQVF
jgi:hypothetical protein